MAQIHHQFIRPVFKKPALAQRQFVKSHNCMSFACNKLYWNVNYLIGEQTVYLTLDKIRISDQNTLPCGVTECFFLLKNWHGLRQSNDKQM